MKLFRFSELEEAIQYSLSGETAVHLHRIVVSSSPRCFKQAVNKGYPIAHIFSQDKELLVHLARRHGINIIYIDKEDTDRQHIDMCGNPLRTLLAEMGYSVEDFRSVES